MTHTEESLMALFYSAADAIHDSLRDDGGVQIAEGLVAKGMIDALRLAIREVLAERDEWKRLHEEDVEARIDAAMKEQP